MRSLLVILVALIIVPAPWSFAQTVPYSSFDDGTTQGWELLDPEDGYLENPGTSGNPGGFLAVYDTLGGGGGIPVVAPDEFIGDLSGFGALAWDEYLFPLEPSWSSYVWLICADGTIYRELSEPPPVPGVWRSRYLPLDSTYWQLGEGTGTASFAYVIRHVASMRFEGEHHSGLGAELGMDNVFLIPSDSTCYVHPDSLDFGVTGLGISKDMSFEIFNNSENMLSGSVSETCTQFNIIAGGGPYSLERGELLIVTVRFEPDSCGADECVIETGDAFCTDVLCVGVGAGARVVPASLDFGDVLLGSSKDSSFTISNVCGGTLSGSVSENCPNYSIVSGGGSYTLVGGESRVVTVRFEPTSCGTRACLIETGEAICSVSSTGVGKGADVSSVFLAFGNLGIGSFRDESFTISNNSGFAISGNIGESCSHFSIVSGGGPYNMAPGGSKIITVRYSPSSAGIHDCIIETGDAVCSDVACAGMSQNLIGTKKTQIHCQPSPFNPITRICFSLEQEENVVLSIYDLSGKIIRTLVNDRMVPGEYSEEWDGCDNKGQRVASGVYFCRLVAGEEALTRKVVLLK